MMPLQGQEQTPCHRVRVLQISMILLILPLSLELSRIFDFRHVPRDLLRLCTREEFDSPVARLGSETRQRSRHPLRLVHHLGCAKRIAIFRGYGEYCYDDADVKIAEEWIKRKQHQLNVVVGTGGKEKNDLAVYVMRLQVYEESRHLSCKVSLRSGSLPLKKHGGTDPPPTPHHRGNHHSCSRDYRTYHPRAQDAAAEAPPPAFG
ncbi:hypothetical protein BJ546DRAFT_434551 [Cryomyces antarcticus]